MNPDTKNWTEPGNQEGKKGRNLNSNENKGGGGGGERRTETPLLERERRATGVGTPRLAPV
jgi:hypothetical protein